MGVFGLPQMGMLGGSRADYDVVFMFRIQNDPMVG